MSRRFVAVLAAVIIAIELLATASFITDVVILDRRPENWMHVTATIALTAASVGVTLAGATIVRHRRRHALGWVLLFGSATTALTSFANAYVWFGQIADSSGAVYARAFDRPGVAYAGWVHAWMGWLWVGFAIPLLVALYPDGRLPGRRWRIVLGAALVVSGATFIVRVLGAVPVTSSVLSTPNPFGQRWTDVLRYRLQVGDEAVTIAGLMFVVALAAVSVMPFARLRHDLRGVPIRLFAFGTAAMGGVTLVSLMSRLSGVGSLPGALVQVVQATALLLISASVIDAVFRHNLAEIEFALRRTAVFGGLSLFIALAYGLSSLGVGSAANTIGAGWIVPFAASAVVAAGLHPIRTWADDFALRLVYGHRPAAPDVIGSVASRLSDADSLALALPTLADSLVAAFGATSAAVALTGDDGVFATSGGSRPGDVTADVEVRFADEAVGELRLTRSPREPWTTAETGLLRLVAAQLAPAFHTFGIDAQLKERAAEAERVAASMQMSRRRIASAQLLARTRFAEEIHGRVFPMLDAVADALTFDDAAGARSAADAALAEVRRIGHGLDPSELRDLGPIAALTAEARDRGVSLKLDIDNSGGVPGRWPEPVERALFLAVVPVIRAAAGSDAGVVLTVHSDETAVRFKVHGPRQLSDDVAADIEDRISATGGDVARQPMGVEGVLPVAQGRLEPTI